MASSQRALAWLLERSGSLELQIAQQDWLEEILEGWIDLQCTFQFEGRQLATWGASDNNDTALLKAFAEALERLAMLTSAHQNSNGFAAHIDPVEARRNAKLELIERDLFFCHFLTKTPLTPFAVPSNWFWASDAADWAEERGLSLRFYHLGSTGLFCRIDGRHHENAFGLISGLAFKPTHEASALSAFVEAGRAATVQRLLPFPTKSLSISEFWELPSPNFGHHGRLALDVGYASSLDWFFAETPGASAPGRELEDSWIEVEDLTLPIESLRDCPYVFARAFSARAQNLFIGKARPEVVNLARLSEFAGRELSFDDLNPLPHPVD
ncbi:MAG: YcaO-like family protein [Bdellovibrionaceae bacterium]|nr:YcaO-like family protein [Pseudobdellovibrionaceae bacterium]